MSDQLPNEPVDGGLQFDEAEYVEAPPTTGPTCAACKQPITDSYYQLVGSILCERCHGQIQSHLAGRSGMLRFAKASVFGFGAAIAGFAIYYGIMKLSGLEIGLISILVGFMVGGAVHKGSEGRGGWLYQLLAVFFTYSAICASYAGVHLVPAIMERVDRKQPPVVEAVAKPGEDNEAKADPDPDAVLKPAAEPLTAAALSVAFVYLLGFLYAFPVILGFQQPIGLLIIGFAIWQAWKLNRRVPLVITGPYSVGSGPGMAPLHA